MKAPALLRDYLRFLRQNKKYWLIPLVVVAVTIATLVILLEGASQDPFIYAIF